MNRCNIPVETGSYGETVATVDRIVSECMYDGIPVDRPSALVAAYSVPDGAPIWMAVDNVAIGSVPSGAVCAHHEANRRVRNNNLRAFARGPRY